MKLFPLPVIDDSVAGFYIKEFYDVCLLVASEVRIFFDEKGNQITICLDCRNNDNKQCSKCHALGRIRFAINQAYKARYPNGNNYNRYPNCKPKRGNCKKNIGVNNKSDQPYGRHADKLYGRHADKL